MFSPKRLITSAMAVLSVAAISASSAAAMSISGGPYASGGQNASAVAANVARPSFSRQDKQVVAPATPTPAPASPAARAPRFTAPASGFSLTDAAITTGGVILLMLLALGSGLAVSRRRTHRAALTH